MEGWKRVLKQHKLSAPGNYIVEGDWTEDSGHRGTLELLALDPPPTAVFCPNFLVMAGALRALKERGLRCPDDVELVSADDSTWLDVFQPPITTVATPSYEIGMEGARLLLRRIKRKPANTWNGLSFNRADRSHIARLWQPGRNRDRQEAVCLRLSKPGHWAANVSNPSVRAIWSPLEFPAWARVCFTKGT